MVHIRVHKPHAKNVPKPRSLNLSSSLNTRAILRRVLHGKGVSRTMKCLVYAELLGRKHGVARW